MHGREIRDSYEFLGEIRDRKIRDSYEFLGQPPAARGKA